MSTPETPDHGSMSDEEFMSLPIPGDPIPENVGADSASAPTQSTADSETGSEGSDADGAATGASGSPEENDGVGTTSVAADDELGTDEQPDEPSSDPFLDDQSEEQEASGEAGTDDSSDELKTKAEQFDELLAPFKVAKREVKVDNIEDARRLMSMGVDYATKMQRMKPHQRALQTLDKAGILEDPEKLNFLIDLDKKNPEAIKRLLKDSDMDPMELDLEDGTEYQPNDHQVSDAEMGLNQVLDSIRDTDTFATTVDVITNKMDKASKQLLQKNPEVIGYLNSHIEAGIYSQIMDEVENARVLGRLTGLSDLEAYKEVGDAMAAKGVFSPTGQTPAATGGNSQDSAQSGSSSDVKDRKRAASPTKGKATAGKPKGPDIGSMTDEEFMAMPPPHG